MDCGDADKDTPNIVDLIEYTKHILSNFKFKEGKEPTDNEISELSTSISKDYFDAFTKVYHYFKWDERIEKGPFPGTKSFY